MRGYEVRVPHFLHLHLLRLHPPQDRVDVPVRRLVFGELYFLLLASESVEQELVLRHLHGGKLRVRLGN